MSEQTGREMTFAEIAPICMERANKWIENNMPEDLSAEPNDTFTMVAMLRNCIHRGMTDFPRPDWTPCADGTNLPRFGETVLVTVEFESGSRIVFQAYRKWTIFQSWFWVYSNDNRCWQKVIAWKRQEPYNPDRKEDADHIVEANKKIEEDTK